MDEEQIKRVKRQQRYDQDIEDLLNNMPNTWYRMYIRLQEEGFDKSEAMDVLFHYMCVTFSS